MSDLQDIIASNTARAFNVGFAAGRREVLSAIETVAFEYHDLEVAAISDLHDELKIRASSYHSERQITLSELPKVPSDD